MIIFIIMSVAPNLKIAISPRRLLVLKFCPAWRPSISEFVVDGLVTYVGKFLATDFLPKCLQLPTAPFAVRPLIIVIVTATPQ